LGAPALTTSQQMGKVSYYGTVLMKLVVDGVIFQLGYSDIGRLWSSILPRLTRYPDLDLVLLDRGSCPAFDGIERVEFPAYTPNANTAADSFLIDKYCRKLGANVFSSTYHTTPVGIPSVLIVYDMMPEVPGFAVVGRPWQEKQIAISFASYYACISENTRSDLNRLYPATTNRSIVTHCGVEHRIFRPRERSLVEQFKSKLGISKPYFVLVAPREQSHGYKNGSHLLMAARGIRDVEFEILCVGGEKMIDPNALAGLPPNVSARCVDLTDDTLGLAYSGAEASIVSAFYEGSGMPIIEAMACGCPVIAARYGSLVENAGDAAIFISGKDESEMRSAMRSVREREHRARLITMGLQRAADLDWDVMAHGFHGLLQKAKEQGERRAMKEFFDRWKKLRRIQAEVDVTI
jgi:glycosyltransferase involved in cell wall biosynthesis